MSRDPVGRTGRNALSVRSTERIPLREFRRGLLKTLAVAFVFTIAGSIGQQLPDANYSAIFAVLTGVSLALMIGSIVAWSSASSYVGDVADFGGWLAELWPYISRAVTWGLAGAGIGALLATALPPRIAEAFTSEPSRLPVGGWIAIAFGGIGIAFGVLEEWRRTGDREKDAPGEGDEGP